MSQFSYPDYTPKFVEVDNLLADGLFISEQATMADILMLCDDILAYLNSTTPDCETSTDKFNQFLVVTVSLYIYIYPLLESIFCRIYSFRQLIHPVCSWTVTLKNVMTVAPSSSASTLSWRNITSITSLSLSPNSKPSSTIYLAKPTLYSNLLASMMTTSPTRTNVDEQFVLFSSLGSRPSDSLDRGCTQYFYYPCFERSSLVPIFSHSLS
jgi:hypothetical protein